MLESPEMFGSLPLDPNNDWIKLSKFVPWREFDLKYADNFRSKKGQRACDSRMALGSVLIKIHYKGMSDEDLTKEIAMNPYLQYFLGLQEYRYECPFDASMMTRFRQRISAEMLAWVNDEIIGRRTAAEMKEEDHKDDDSDSAGNGAQEENKGGESEEENQGTLILDATCAPQNIRFPTAASLLNEARQKAEEIIDTLHENGLTDGRKPRDYRVKALRKYNSFSKARKKTMKMIRDVIRQQLGFLKRDLKAIDSIEAKHPECLKETLPVRKQEMLQVIRTLYFQQEYMYRMKTHKVENRIVSISQPWVRPIVRGKQTADVEFGAKVEMSVVDGFLRIEDLRWDAYNECTTFQKSVEAYKRSYGHYPQRVLADTIFRTRENMKYCKERGIHLNGPKLGKPYSDPAIQKQQKKLEWQESGERGEIERNFGVGKRRYCLDCIVTKLKGIDGVSKADYEEHLDENLDSLVDRLKRKAYHPQPARRVEIPKDNGKTRPLSIYCYEDKLVQEALRRVLEAVFEPMFYDEMMGFRPNRSCHMALRKLNHMLEKEYTNYVLDADIKGFFDHLDHGWIIKFVESRIKDPKIIRLVRVMLKAGIMKDYTFEETEEGSGQGSVCSPILANIYMHYVLIWWFKEKVQLKARGFCGLVVYADDFVVCFQHKDEAQAFYNMLGDRMEHFGLSLEKEKSRLIEFGRYADENSKHRNGKKPETFTFLVANTANN